MDQAIKAKWLEALRSGEFVQGNGKLRMAANGKDYFCCLGVLCELAVREGVVSQPAIDRFDAYSYDGNHHFPPMAVRRWAGLTDDDPAVTLPSDDDKWNGEVVTSLSELNDEGRPDEENGPFTFAQIADVIEEHL